MQALATVRNLLLQPPTTNVWWDIIKTLDKAPKEEQTILKDYLREHTSQDPVWKMTCVPHNDWPEDSLGHELSRLHKETLKTHEDTSLVYCPPGTYNKGGSNNDPESEDLETPVTVATLSRGFWVMQCPVTQDLWEQYCDHNPSESVNSSDKATRPVENISYFNALRFANILSEAEGLRPVYAFQETQGEFGRLSYRLELDSIQWDREADGYRLLTEMEWEYAARAGCRGAHYGPLDEIAWYQGNSTHPVGTKLPNAWEVYDMLGHLWEWCFDSWQDRLPGGKVTDWVGETFNERKSVRGGCWISSADSCRTSSRSNVEASNHSTVFGFRLARNG